MSRYVIVDLEMCGVLKGLKKVINSLDIFENRKSSVNICKI